MVDTGFNTRERDERCETKSARVDVNACCEVLLIICDWRQIRMSVIRCMDEAHR